MAVCAHREPRHAITARRSRPFKGQSANRRMHRQVALPLRNSACPVGKSSCDTGSQASVRTVRASDCVAVRKVALMAEKSRRRQSMEHHAPATLAIGRKQAEFRRSNGAGQMPAGRLDIGSLLAPGFAAVFLLGLTSYAAAHCARQQGPPSRPSGRLIRDRTTTQTRTDHWPRRVSRVDVWYCCPRVALQKRYFDYRVSGKTGGSMSALDRVRRRRDRVALDTGLMPPLSGWLGPGMPFDVVSAGIAA